jgi:hypothetical protein
MTRFIAAVTLLLMIGMGKGYGMELNTALKLVQAWGRDSKDMTLIGQLAVDPRGGFITKSAGAFFRYDSVTRQLLVSGLVGYNIKLHSKHPTTWEKMVRASQRETATLGEGVLELHTKKLFSFDPDVILLTKTFNNDELQPAQFVIEVDWLLSAAHYWFMKRYNDVLTTPETDLIREGPLNNARMLRERPRPW